jgi:hypothetical protein
VHLPFTQLHKALCDLAVNSIGRTEEQETAINPRRDDTIIHRNTHRTSRRMPSSMLTRLNRVRRLVRQPHLVMFEALSLVVASFGACLVDSSPIRPVVGVVAWVVWMGQCGP